MTLSRGPEIINKLVTDGPDLGVQFTEAWPGQGVQRTTFVVLDFESEISMSDSMTNMGPTNYVEVGKLTNYLLVSLPGKTATEVREKAFEIADQFADWVKADIHLGDVVCNWAYVSGVQWTPGMGDNSRDGALRIDLSWHDENL